MYRAICEGTQGTYEGDDIVNSFEVVPAKITEAVDLPNADGEYYFAMTGQSNNSRPVVYSVYIQ